MITVIVEATVNDNDAFDKLTRDIIADTRAYDGCEGITVQRNLDEPAKIMLIEHWNTREQYDKYLKWREDTGVLGKIGELGKLQWATEYSLLLEHRRLSPSF